MLGPDNAIWDDDEWISWDEINQQIQHKEWTAKYPNADRTLIPIFEQLLRTAEEYHKTTGIHLQVYGDIGELWGAITYGIKPHRNYAQGSDGRLGDKFIEVKTISPCNKRNEVVVDMKGNFNKLLIVRVNEEFEIAHRQLERNLLPKNDGGRVRVKWSNL